MSAEPEDAGRGAILAEDPGEPDSDCIQICLLRDLTFRDVRQFLSSFHALFKRGKKRFRLDLSRIRFIDSAGAGALVQLHTSIGNIGGELVLLHAGSAIRNTLRAVRFDRIVVLEPEAVRPGGPPVPHLPEAPADAGSGDTGGSGEVPELSMDDLLSGELLEDLPPPAGGSEDLTVRILTNVINRNAHLLRHGLLRRLREGNLRVLVELSALEFLDSEGIGVLVESARAYRNAGGELILAGASPGILRVLRIVKVDQVLTLRDSP